MAQLAPLDPKEQRLLSQYGSVIDRTRRLGGELERVFKTLGHLQKELDEEGVVISPKFDGPLQAAWQAFCNEDKKVTLEAPLGRDLP